MKLQMRVLTSYCNNTQSHIGFYLMVCLIEVTLHYFVSAFFLSIQICHILFIEKKKGLQNSIAIC